MSMTHAELYLFHREQSSVAFSAGNGALSTGHAASAHLALVNFAKENGLTSTDDAAAAIRSGRVPVRMVGCETEDGLIQSHPAAETCHVCKDLPANG